MGIMMSELMRESDVIRRALESQWPNGDLRAQQVIALAEEIGEFVGAARRFMGMARRTGTFEDMAAELADVVITAFVTAEVFEIVLPVEIEHKLDIIMNRGWKDPR